MSEPTSDAEPRWDSTKDAGVNILSESLSATDALGAAGATAPRVSLADIEGAIEQVDYLNLGDAIERCTKEQNPRATAASFLMTLCTITMKNGFVVIGKSACVSKENFDEEKGRTFAREDAVRQIWPLMAFALRERLHGQA